MFHFSILKFVLGKLGINFTGEHAYKTVLLVVIFVMLGIAVVWVYGLIEENERYEKEIKTYKQEVSILRKNEKKLSDAIAESKSKLEEMSVDLKEKNKKFEEWRNKHDQEKYSNKIVEIFKMIDESRSNASLEACLNVNIKISGLKYEDF